MKTLSILTLLLCSLSLSAQLELVGTFDSMARTLYLADDEPAIMLYTPEEELIELYNPDQSLIAIIEIPVEYQGPAQFNLFHVSRTLFDCDPSNIEYMISYHSTFDISEAYVKIFREDGTELFNLPEHIFYDQSTYMGNPVTGPGMIEDDEGVVFVFSNTSNLPMTAPVTLYRSCGSIPCPCYGMSSEGQGTGLTEFDDHRSNYNLYPNPGNNQFKLEYDLPDGYQRGELQLIDMSGRIVLEKPVGPSMSYIVVNTEGITAGRYQVVLTTEEGMQLSTSYIELD